MAPASSDFVLAARLIEAQSLLNELQVDTAQHYSDLADEREHSRSGWFTPQARLDKLRHTAEMFKEALAALVALVPAESIRRETTLPEDAEPGDLVEKARYILEVVQAGILRLGGIDWAKRIAEEQQRDALPS